MWGGRWERALEVWWCRIASAFWMVGLLLFVLPVVGLMLGLGCAWASWLSAGSACRWSSAASRPFLPIFGLVLAFHRWVLSLGRSLSLLGV